VIAVFAYLGSFFAPITAAPFTLIEYLLARCRPIFRNLKRYVFGDCRLITRLLMIMIDDEPVTETMRLTPEKLNALFTLQRVR